MRWPTEPLPVFAHGRFCYLVSIVGGRHFVMTQPVERTVVIDAIRRRIVAVYNHADRRASERLRRFFLDGARR